VWDDHDFGANDADGTSPSRPAALSTYRENVPHYGLAGPDAAIYQAFTVGRMRVIVTDVRSARSPATDLDDANKTMLGAEQKAWFKQELLEAGKTHEVVLWVNSVPWISGATTNDDWGAYATERRELADFIAANDLAEGLVMASGDAHMLAIDDGTNSDYSAAGDAAFPILHAAALDRPGSTKGGPYSEGAIPGGGQFGLISVEDDGGEQIDVTLTGLNWEGEELLSHRFSVPAQTS
jgi:phosphodiesterase/alkaline phosphatase D-like protein